MTKAICVQDARLQKMRECINKELVENFDIQNGTSYVPKQRMKEWFGLPITRGTNYELFISILKEYEDKGWYVSSDPMEFYFRVK